MLKHTLAAVVAAFTLVLGLGLANTPASADVTGNVLQIVEVGTDAMGADSFANRNREFVTFKNVSGSSVDIAGVLVEDNWAHARTVAGDSHTCNTYKITDLPDNAGTMLAPGESVTVFNGVRWGGGRKVGSVYQLFANSDVDCGTFGQFFNNDADTAWVTRNGPTGEVLSSKSWDWNGGYFIR